MINWDLMASQLANHFWGVVGCVIGGILIAGVVGLYLYLTGRD